MLCRICVVQIQPRKYVLDDAGYAAPTRQHELDHTDHTDHTDLDREARIDDLVGVCELFGVFILVLLILVFAVLVQPCSQSK